VLDMSNIGEMFNLTEDQVFRLSVFLEEKYLKYSNDPDRIEKTVKAIRSIRNKDEREASLLVYGLGLHLKEEEEH